jgi:hypothetical protein
VLRWLICELHTDFKTRIKFTVCYFVTSGALGLWDMELDVQFFEPMPTNILSNEDLFQNNLFKSKNDKNSTMIENFAKIVLNIIYL